MMIFNERRELRNARSFKDPRNYIKGLYQNEFIKFAYLFKKKNFYEFCKKIGCYKFDKKANKLNIDSIVDLKQFENKLKEEFGIKIEMNFRKEFHNFILDNIEFQEIDGEEFTNLGEAIEIINSYNKNLGIENIPLFLERDGHFNELDKFNERSDSFNRNEVVEKKIRKIDFGV